MHNLVLLILAAFIAMGGMGASVPSPLLLTSAAAAISIEPTACQGSRRNYRSFNHCIRINSSRSVRYCSRICGVQTG